MRKQIIEGNIQDVVKALEGASVLEGKRLRFILVDDEELATIYASEQVPASGDVFAEMESLTVRPAIPADVSRESMHAHEDLP